MAGQLGGGGGGRRYFERILILASLNKGPCCYCRSLAAMCAIDLRPISIVDGVGFREFVRKLEPAYPMPSSTTVKSYIAKIRT